MRHPRFLIFLGLFPFACGYLMSYLLRAVNAVVAPDLVRDFGVGPAELGLLTSAYLFLFCIIQLPLGVLLDRYGARRVQTVLLLIAAAGVLAFSMAQNVTTLVIARGIIGLGFAAGLMACFKSSADWVSAERRSVVNATMVAMGGLGIVVATQPTEWLVTQIGWRHTFQFFAAVIFSIATFIWFGVPRKFEGQAGADFGQQWQELVAVIRTPLFKRLAPLAGLSTGLPIAFQTLWAAPWFRDILGQSRDQVAQSLFYMALAFVFGIFFTGVVADRMQKRGVDAMRIYLFCTVLQILSLAVIVLQIKSMSLLAWMIFVGPGQAGVLLFPWFTARVGKNIAGRANATLNFSMFVVAFIAQYLVGVIIGFWPATSTSYDIEAYRWAFGLFLALLTASAIWYLTAPKHISEAK